jgi:hypothetical protein
MTGRVLEMKKDFIVYSFYESDRAKDKETDKFFKEMKIKTLPTIIVFNGGKEVRRHVGEVSKDKVLKGVKTAKDQEESIWPDWLKLW